jgi:hypothetical protein
MADRAPSANEPRHLSAELPKVRAVLIIRDEM